VRLESKEHATRGLRPDLGLVRTGGGVSSIPGFSTDGAWHDASADGSFDAVISRLACGAGARQVRAGHPSIRTCFRSRHPYIYARRFVFNVADRTDPEVSNLSGNLLDGGTRAGSQRLTFTASDRGGGLSQIFLRVNGIAAASQRFQCDLAGLGARQVGDSLTPCPGKRSETLTANASTAPFKPGLNTIQACATDFADPTAKGTANTDCSSAQTVIANGGCDKVATTDGSDSGPGSALSPFRTVQKMASSLSSGQVGCLRAGTYASSLTVTRPAITLTSFPGERATLKGRLWVDADRVTISGLNLNGANTGNSPAVSANDDTFDNVEVTNQHTEGVCFVLGSGSGYGRAVRTVIENSRIHDCGPVPGHNQGHGIYVSRADAAVIRNNWIYDNTDRGIQLYPDARFAHVYGNVIDGNGEGIIISGDGNTASSGNLVEDNVISNSKLRWNVESNWPGNRVGVGNVVRNNCVWATNSNANYRPRGGVASGWGFSASGNVIADPLFTSRFWKDFSLQAGSPCAFVYG
jgi:hypothetical protein